MLYRSSHRIKRITFKFYADGARLNSKRNFSPESVSGSSNNVLVTRFERRPKTAQINRAKDYLTHFWKNYHRLVFIDYMPSSSQGKSWNWLERPRNTISILLEFFLRKTWFSNRRVGWRKDAFLFRR